MIDHKHYFRWLYNEHLEDELKQQLIEMQGDEKTIKECFHKYLDFGTGGMRGELGAGTNRMNIYTIRMAASGLAAFIEQNGRKAKERGVVIAYDSRHHSKRFALESALTLANCGIKAFVFENIRPTPELSFAVRHLGAFSGIVITASHNPKEYNGFKVYDEHGGQLTPDIAKQVIHYVHSVENEFDIAVMDKEEAIEKRQLIFIGKEIDHAYLQALTQVTVDKDVIAKMKDTLKIVYTPLHGAGHYPVVQSLKNLGFNNVTVVKEQAIPDPNFSTVTSPNPEEKDAFRLAIKYGQKVRADLLLATDPDSDRLGVAIKDSNGSYRLLTGNQLGALLLHYLLQTRKEKGILPENGVVLKTIVTSEFGREIARSFGVETIDTLTGFKYIGEKITEFEQAKSYQFQFGYEESYGYLVKAFARDKDAVQASILVCELASYYRLLGKTVIDGLNDLYKEYGYYLEDLQSITLKGIEGSLKIKEMMDHLRRAPFKALGDERVVVIEDYKRQITDHIQIGKSEPLSLPKENVLKFKLTDDAWICFRPSGTEPKLKIYYGVKEKTFAQSKEKITLLKEQVKNMLSSF